ncbi:lethal(2) giant larvae protein homolog Sro77p [Trichomonascus vanleenenianus]|uniref:putative Rab GTPase-binding protein SRO77 n=1 Tax=Trichomonascus vanleenenianus TaxID=2268995 RepID=UPI003ECABB74
MDPYRPLRMTSMFSRLKNLGENDFSEALTDSLFKIDDVARFGLSGAITDMAFDPVQSLLAIGTDAGKIHVFGQRNVEVVFTAAGGVGVPIKFLRIIRSLYLVAVDQRSRITVINMDTRELASQYDCPREVTALESDPSLDWLFLGLENGQVIVYDVDRGNIAPMRIDNLQKSVSSKFRMSPVLSLALHPRDVSVLLVCYTDTLVTFSLVKSEIILSLRYEVPPNAPGGETDYLNMQQLRHPKYVAAVWHPNGHHILSAHVDGSLVFWDATEGNLLQARTLTDTDVNVPRRSTVSPDEGVRTPIRQIAWICSKNPEDTSILVSGGDLFEGSIKGLTMLYFGSTPQVAITSYQNMGHHYANPKKQKMFPMPEGINIASFIMLPTVGPYYAGNHNPDYFLVRVATGELIVVSYPEGNVVTDPTLLPPSLGWITPFISVLEHSLVPRNQWLGMMAAVKSKGELFRGGAPARRHLRNFQYRTALCTGHEDGTIKLWDASHGEIEDANVIEVSMSNALQEHNSNRVTHISFAGAVAELSASVESGETVLFNFAVNKGNLSSSMSGGGQKAVLEDIRHRAPLNVKEGFMPQTLVSNPESGPVTALKNSSIGFVAIAYASGDVCVVDKRGPAVIYMGNLAQIFASVNRRRSRGVGGQDYGTYIEFAIHSIQEENYSSIVMSVGSNEGNVYTFRVVPRPQGGYVVEFVGLMDVADDTIISLSPINAAIGVSAVAETSMMARLAEGIAIPGALIAVTPTEARVFRQPNSKITHKRFPFRCASAGIAYLREGDSLALVCVTESSEIKVFGVPHLREISSRSLPYPLDPAYAKDSLVTRTGDLVVRPNKWSGGMVRIWGRGIKAEDILSDALYDVMKELPLRPTISAVQWIKGRQHTTAEELDLIIGGSRRPKSKKQLEEEDSRKEQERLIRDQQRRKAYAQTSRSGANEYDDMTDAVDERGFKLGSIQSALDNLEKSSADYMNSLSGMVKDAKSSAFKASFKSRFGL